jgi:hypothetical protein
MLRHWRPVESEAISRALTFDMAGRTKGIETMEDERVGNQQRTQVLDLLSAALEQGYLTLDEYEVRMAAVSAAKMISVLHSQVADLPAQFRWDPRAATQQPNAAAGGRPHTDDNVRTFAITSLVLGIVSIPLSLCFIGWLFGIAAIFLSIPGSKGASGWSKALVGRVLGVIGIVLSLGFIAIGIIANVTKP